MKNIDNNIRYLAASTRVSTDREAKEGFSIEGQVKSNSAWAEDRDIEIVKWYKDEGISGARENRPQYDKMVHEVYNEIVKVDGIIFFSTSRMCRNLAVTTATRNKLKKLRKVIVSAHENLIIKDAASALAFNLMGAVNESFCEGGGELVVQQLTHTATGGFWTGGAVPCGYDSIEVLGKDGKQRHKLVINNEESIIIKKIFDLSLRGHQGKPLGVVEIAKYLNQNAMFHKGKKWSKYKVHNTLINSLYMGQRRFRKGRSDEIVIQDPPIEEEEVFNKVQKGLGERQLKNTESKGKQSKLMLTGILKCNKCKKIS